MNKFCMGFIVSLVFSGVMYGDIFDRITDCENDGGGACVYNILRELASRPTNSGGSDSLTSFVSYECDGNADTMTIKTRSASSGAENVFVFDGFFRHRFECANMAATLATEASNVVGSKTVAACNNETYKYLYKFQITPGIDAKYVGTERFDNYSDCVQKSTEINQKASN